MRLPLFNKTSKGKNTKTSSKAQPKMKFILSRKQKIIAIVGGVLVLGGAAYAGYAAYTMDEVSAGGCVSHSYKQGSTGTCVKYIQKLNNFIGYKQVSVDGLFSSGTKSAIVTDQKKFGLSADGVVGPKTWNMLCYPQMGYMDANGKGHQAWPQNGWRGTARAAGCKGA